MKTIITISLSLCFMATTCGQDVLTQQRILQYCLNLEDVRVLNDPVTIDGAERFAMAAQEFLSDGLQLSVGDIHVSILSRDDLFFNIIDQFISVSKLEITSVNAVVELFCTDRSHFYIVLKGRNDFQEIMDSEITQK